MLFGAHVSTAGGIDTAIDRGAAIGARLRAGVHAEPAHVEADRARARGDRALQGAARRGRDRRRRLPRALPLQPRRARRRVYGSRSRRCARRSTPRCAIEADGVVFHVGSHLGAGLDAALKQVVAALKKALKRCKGDTWLLIENSAGTGGTIGRSIEELATLVDALGRHERLGICLDSCHLTRRATT